MSTTQNTNEVRVWEGSPSQLINLKLYLLCGITFFLVVPLVIAIIQWVKTRCIRYELTTQRIFSSRGVFSKDTEVLELYRVRDLDILQPFFLRLFGLGDIVLQTSDKTSPTFVFRAVPDPRALSDQIRSHVEACRVAKGTRELDLAEQHDALDGMNP